MNSKSDFSLIVEDNERAAQEALDHGDYLQAFILIHTLMESLLRLFLDETDEDVKFSSLVKKYEKYVNEQNYNSPTLVDELTKLNRRRNRITHQLWKKGYSFTNKQSKPAAYAAFVLYALIIEFFGTWEPDLNKMGFKLT
jgi:hypothetical protein